MENYIDPGRLRHHRGSLRQVLRDHDRPPVRRRLHHRRHDDRRVHVSDGRRGDGLHQHAVRRHAVGSRAQRRLCAADRVPVGAVRREPPHRQRPLAADGRAQGAGEPSPAGARPALRLLAEPRDRRRGDRHFHRIRHHQPRQEQGILRGDVAPLDLRGLLSHLHAAAREIRHQGPPRRRARSLEPHHQEELRPQGRAVLRGRLAGELLAHRGPARRRTSSGSSTSIRAGTPSSATSGSGTTSSAVPGEKIITFNERRRLRLSAPLLELPRALPDPRGHGGRRDRRQAAHLRP